MLIIQFLFACALAAAGMTVVSLFRLQWRRGVGWGCFLLLAVAANVLVLRSWNRVMLKAEADHEARQAASGPAERR